MRRALITSTRGHRHGITLWQGGCRATLAVSTLGLLLHTHVCEICSAKTNPLLTPTGLQEAVAVPVQSLPRPAGSPDSFSSTARTAHELGVAARPRSGRSYFTLPMPRRPHDDRLSFLPDRTRTARAPLESPPRRHTSTPIRLDPKTTIRSPFRTARDLDATAPSRRSFLLLPEKSPSDWLYSPTSPCMHLHERGHCNPPSVRLTESSDSPTVSSMANGRRVGILYRRFATVTKRAPLSGGTDGAVRRSRHSTPADGSKAYDVDNVLRADSSRAVGRRRRYCAWSGRSIDHVDV